MSFDASWLEINKGFLDILEEWMDHILSSYTDTYFVTELQVDELQKSEQNLTQHFQVIQWMQNPTGVQVLRDFEDWKDKCVVKGQPYCSLPNPCPLTTRELPGETFRLC